MKVMKFRHIIPALMLAAGALSLGSCEDMMDLGSDDYVFGEDNRLDSANDSLYSSVGILSQLQKVGERYVLLGELRGDLVTVTENADMSLREVSEFTAGSDNVYADRRDYYSIINNCNYALERMDTTIVEHQNRVMVPEYAAIRCIRAWTYFQMGLTYGSVKYVDKPILSLEESEMEYPVIGLDDLVDRLIDDISRYAAEKTPDNGLGSVYFQPRLLLADMFLYRNRYAEAARLYYEYINESHQTMSSYYSNCWETAQASEIKTREFLGFTTYYITGIRYNTDLRADRPNLINLTYSDTPSLVAARWWVDEMAAVTHFHINNQGAPTIQGYLEGDTRGRFVFANGLTQESVSVGYAGESAETLITKYRNQITDINDQLTNPSNPLASGCMINSLPLMRLSHVYLRYAEALNRMGKPTMAFAVLKYGLKPDVMADPEKIDPAELEDNLAWTNFSSTDYSGSYGTACHGRGLGIDLQQSTYVIPEFDTPEQTMEWVEDEIMYELAAETQFEGNRFFDLVRVNAHRGGTEYFADRVSRRFENRDAARTRLLDRANWWIK